MGYIIIYLMYSSFFCIFIVQKKLKEKWIVVVAVAVAAVVAV